MREPDILSSAEAATRSRIRTDPEVETTHGLARAFVTMVQHQEAHRLDGCLDACAKSRISGLVTFAAGLRQDYAAVRAAVELPWSSGQAEGQINRLKMLKRQMYGRAGFDLLRVRVLHAA